MIKKVGKGDSYKVFTADGSRALSKKPMSKAKALLQLHAVEASKKKRKGLNK